MTVHSPLSSATRLPTILLVDDDRTVLMIIGAKLEALGYSVETAENGADAYALLRQDPARADIVVTDRLMPVMDGLALTRRLKREESTRHIPIVILTGNAAAEDVSAGIEAGAFYYLTKSSSEQLIAAVVGSAMKETARQRRLRDQLGGHQSAFANMQMARFTLRRPEEVEPVASMLASMFERPERAIQGIFELLQNGVEHGVLRFGLERKTALMREGRWADAVLERAGDPAFGVGMVEATAMRKEQGLLINVKDDGPGFNWRPFIVSDPSRASAICGRGISRAANFVFDRLSYNEAGNQVVALLSEERKVKW